MNRKKYLTDKNEAKIIQEENYNRKDMYKVFS